MWVGLKLSEKGPKPGPTHTRIACSPVTDLPERVRPEWLNGQAGLDLQEQGSLIYKVTDNHPCFLKYLNGFPFVLHYNIYIYKCSHIFPPYIITLSVDLVASAVSG